jgi:hypothetical protein
MGCRQSTDWDNPSEEDVMQVGQTLAVFAMTAAEQRRVIELTTGWTNHRVQITRFEVLEGEDGPSLELRLFNPNEDDRKGWGYHIWSDARERTLSGKKPVRKALAAA